MCIFMVYQVLDAVYRVLSGLPVEGLRGLWPPTANCLHQSFIDHASKVMVVTTRKIVVTMGAMMAGLLAVLTLHSDSC